MNLHEGLVIRVGHVVSDFAPNASPDLARSAARKLQRACQLYVAYRDGQISPKRFRAEVNSLKRVADALSGRIDNMRPFTRSELELDRDGRPIFSDLQRDLNLLVTHLETVQAQESAKGRDYTDTPDAILVGDLLAIFLTLKGRTRPPAVRFDAKKDSVDPDDVSSEEFGRFVIAVEAAVVSSVAAKSGTSGRRYRLKDKRAAITGAIRRSAAR